MPTSIFFNTTPHPKEHVQTHHEFDAASNVHVTATQCTRDHNAMSLSKCWLVRTSMCFCQVAVCFQCASVNCIHQRQHFVELLSIASTYLTALYRHPWAHRSLPRSLHALSIHWINVRTSRCCCNVFCLSMHHRTSRSKSSLQCISLRTCLLSLASKNLRTCLCINRHSVN